MSRDYSNRIYKKRLCLKCGAEYQPSTGYQKWCSTCRPEAKREREGRRYIKYRKEKIEYSAKYAAAHPKETLEYERKYRMTHPDKTRAKVFRAHAKRRLLGFIPLNEPFDGSVGHHLDKEHAMYVPEELHRSIKHNVWTGENMTKINELARRYA